MICSRVVCSLDHDDWCEHFVIKRMKKTWFSQMWSTWRAPLMQFESIVSLSSLHLQAIRITTNDWVLDGNTQFVNLLPSEDKESGLFQLYEVDLNSVVTSTYSSSSCSYHSITHTKYMWIYHVISFIWSHGRSIKHDVLCIETSIYSVMLRSPYLITQCLKATYIV